MIDKAKWFLDKICPIILGIDDITNSICHSRFLREQCDCGYLGLNNNGIYDYFMNYLLKKYPEIRATYFLVMGPSSAYLDGAKTDTIYKNDGFLRLLQTILDRSDEIAYHGHNHGYSNATLMDRKWCREFEQYSPSEYFNIIKNDLDLFKKTFGYQILGGRTPCYSFREDLIEGLIDLKFRWWSFDFEPFKNNISLKYGDDKIIAMPSNISGDAFVYGRNAIKSKIKHLLNIVKIEKMMKSGYVISIAEHFMNARPDGKRQTPNVYDDINSLDFIFGYLRNKDVWYATFSECANYYESYNNTDILDMGDGVFEIKYKGNWKMFLTFISDHRYLQNIQTKEIYEGFMKNNRWLFNDLVEGIYRGHKDVF
jgi:hypothetical protein